MGIPVVVRCECGEETRGNAGDALVCGRCGRRYETAGVGSQQLGAAGAAAVKHKIMTRLGIGVVGLISVGALFASGVAAMLIALVVSGAIWFGVIMRRLRAKELDRILSAETTQIKAQK
jgi:hypothetical protein